MMIDGRNAAGLVISSLFEMERAIYLAQFFTPSLLLYTKHGESHGREVPSAKTIKDEISEGEISEPVLMSSISSPCHVSSRNFVVLACRRLGMIYEQPSPDFSDVRPCTQPRQTLPSLTIPEL